MPQFAPGLQIWIVNRVCAKLCNWNPCSVNVVTYYWLFPQALEWIHDTGEFYLSTHTSTGSSIHHTQELLKEHEDFQITAKVCVVWVCVCVCLFVNLLLCKRRRGGWKLYMSISVPVVVVLSSLCCVYVCTVLRSAVRPIPRAVYCPLSSLLCHCYCVREQAIVSIKQTHWFLTLSLSHIYLSSTGAAFLRPSLLSLSPP